MSVSENLKNEKQISVSENLKKVVNGDGKFYEDLVKEVREDFYYRQKERKALDRQWELNINYLNGNQYCEVGINGEVGNEDKSFYWQQNQVYNHIAPIFETRIAKLSRVRPIMSVRSASDEEGDLKTAKLSTSILNSAYQNLDIAKKINSANIWSEVCGTSFYKIVWNDNGGKKITVDGESIFEGDVNISVCPPFEIYPDSLQKSDVEDCRSIIHALAMNVKDIENIYGKICEGEDIEVFASSLNTAQNKLAIDKEKKKDFAIVIEKYEKPSKQYPKGRVITIAGETLLYIGELPFTNGKDGQRTFPFIMQKNIEEAGSFFGKSVIERLIPIQKAYNAVKNRKHEFLNRIAMGIITVEDGSVDTDELSEEGLCPGKVVVYRQGSNPPQMMQSGSVPIEFTYEEERLSNEFVLISGISEISRNSSMPANLTSGVALQLLIEQDDTRLTITAEHIRNAVKDIGKHILRLYKQFVKASRLMRKAEGKIAEVYYFNSSDISSDDIVFDTENELSFTPAQRKSLVIDMLNMGLLADEDGKLSNRMRAKVLEILGFGGLENVQDLSSLHVSKSENENLKLMKNDVEVDEYDDHEIHIAEHTRFLLGSEYETKKDQNGEVKNRFISHIREHRKMKSYENSDVNNIENIKE